MILMHSRPKEQREAIRQLVHSVLTREMSTFNPERFKDWIKDVDAKFRKVGLTLLFTIRDRSVHFTIKEIRSRRTAYKFTASSHVPFEDRDVVMSVGIIRNESLAEGVPGTCPRPDISSRGAASLLRRNAFPAGIHSICLFVTIQSQSSIPWLENVPHLG